MDRQILNCRFGAQQRDSYVVAALASASSAAAKAWTVASAS
jgi:hypothetical protein